jgi:hypothetical protein
MGLLSTANPTLFSQVVEYWYQCSTTVNPLPLDLPNVVAPESILYLFKCINQGLSRLVSEHYSQQHNFNNNSQNNNSNQISNKIGPNSIVVQTITSIYNLLRLLFQQHTSIQLHIPANITSYEIYHDLFWLISYSNNVSLNLNPNNTFVRSLILSTADILEQMDGYPNLESNSLVQLTNPAESIDLLVQFSILRILGHLFPQNAPPQLKKFLQVANDSPNRTKFDIPQDIPQFEPNSSNILSPSNPSRSFSYPEPILVITIDIYSIYGYYPQLNALITSSLFQIVLYTFRHFFSRRFFHFESAQSHILSYWFDFVLVYAHFPTFVAKNVKIETNSGQNNINNFSNSLQNLQSHQTPRKDIQNDNNLNGFGSLSFDNDTFSRNGRDGVRRDDSIGFAPLFSPNPSPILHDRTRAPQFQCELANIDQTNNNNNNHFFFNQFEQPFSANATPSTTTQTLFTSSTSSQPSQAYTFSNQLFSPVLIDSRFSKQMTRDTPIPTHNDSNPFTTPQKTGFVDMTPKKFDKSDKPDKSQKSKPKPKQYYPLVPTLSANFTPNTFLQFYIRFIHDQTVGTTSFPVDTKLYSPFLTLFSRGAKFMRSAEEVYHFLHSYVGDLLNFFPPYVNIFSFQNLLQFATTKYSEEGNLQLFRSITRDQLNNYGIELNPIVDPLGVFRHLHYNPLIDDCSTNNNFLRKSVSESESYTHLYHERSISSENFYGNPLNTSFGISIGDNSMDIGEQNGSIDGQLNTSTLGSYNIVFTPKPTSHNAPNASELTSPTQQQQQQQQQPLRQRTLASFGIKSPTLSMVLHKNQNLIESIENENNDKNVHRIELDQNLNSPKNEILILNKNNNSWDRIDELSGSTDDSFFSASINRRTNHNQNTQNNLLLKESNPYPL